MIFNCAAMLKLNISSALALNVHERIKKSFKYTHFKTHFSTFLSRETLYIGGKYLSYHIHYGTNCTFPQAEEPNGRDD